MTQVTYDSSQELSLPTEVREYIKKEYHHLDTHYFNTSYFGPSPYNAKQKVSRALQKELDPSSYDYQTWMGVSERIRISLAELLGANPDNITHSSSSSDTVNIVANGYPFKKGDHVASINGDYPSNVLPWMRAAETRGIHFDLLDYDDSWPYPTAKWLEQKLHPQTKIFNISHIQFDTGRKIDLVEIGEMLKRKGIMFVVDVTQSLGGMEVTAQELELIDVLTCSSYKWMLGPYGHAFAYFSDRTIETIEHHTGNWTVSPNSRVVYNLLDYTTKTLPGARKYDRGQASNMLAMSCLEGGLEFLSEVGLKRIRQTNARLRDFFLENYPKDKYELRIPKDHMGNIVSLRAKNLDPIDLERELKFRNVDVSIRQGHVRLSFHIFNHQEQVETLIETMDI